MKTVNDIYNFLGHHIIRNAPFKWSEAVLSVEVLPGFSSYNGVYMTEQGTLNMNVFDFPIETGEYITALHKITTEGGHNKWNKGKFKVSSDRKFEVDFVWDEEWQQEIDERNRLEVQKDPTYKPPKWHWEK